MTWDERVLREKYIFIRSSTDMAILVTVGAGTNTGPRHRNRCGGDIDQETVLLADPVRLGRG